MQRVIPVTVGIVVVPAMLALGASLQQPAKPAGQVPKPFQDEAPIRVRNGSIHVETLRGTTWTPDGARWSQNQDSPSATSNLIAEVRFAGGGTCTVHGTTITISYGDNRSFRVLKANRRIKVVPKNDFSIDASRKDLLKSSAAGYVTEVKGSGTGTAICKMGGASELNYVCVASTDIGLGNCR